MRPVHLVAHTHWDREWYLTFEGFREKLIPTLDGILDLLDSDPRWSHFHLDGQTAMVDDYLDVRPERAADITRHVARGALSIGPWVTLVGEFLTSGESIIRNLEDGLARCAEIGVTPRVAYLPDQFGHIGQMPQILARFGFEHTVVWRGVPSEVMGTGFRWASPDGTDIDAFYLPFGYGQGARMEADPDGFVHRIEDEVARLEPFLRDGEPALLPVGDDHEPALSNLPSLIEGARAQGLDVRLVSYADHVSHAPSPPVSVTGELRSGARANLLPNTYGVRPHQKVARARVEHLLERYAEPLAALSGGRWPTDLFSEAWGLLHLNGAHDSVCGCSTDEVAVAVDARTQQAEEIALEIISDSFGRLAASMSDEGSVVFNPSPFERFGVPGLGWKVMDGFEPGPIKLSPWIDGQDVVIPAEPEPFYLRIEDQADVGDLYTFEADGLPEFSEPSVRDDEAHFATSRADVTLSAWIVPGEDLIRLELEITNDSPDHRIRLLVRTDGSTGTSVAGAPFEIVTRPRTGEGGESEPPSKWWPARGFVSAGSTSVLGEGVFEYEVTEDALAITLMRCTGNISRQELSTRKVVAGPDVPTPGAQLLGTHLFRFGLCAADSGPALIERWECFALDPLVTRSMGGGDRRSEGTLLEMTVPALSAIRRVAGALSVTLWNPSPSEAAAMVAGRPVTLRPSAIETVVVED